MNKEHEMRSLMAEWGGCEECPMLVESRQQQVFGSGALFAKPGPIALVGEAPGGTEDGSERAIPFIGAAGQILMEALLNLHLYDPRFADLYPGKVGQPINFVELRELLHERFWFTNLCLCRPEDNRDPTTFEMKKCWPRLAAELYIVDPVIVVALGRTAFQFLTKSRKGIGNARGALYRVEVPGKVMPVEYPVLPTHHPAYVDRIQDFDEPDGIAKNWFDDLTKTLTFVDTLNNLTFGTEMPNRDIERN